MKSDYGDAPELPTSELIKLKLTAPQFWVVLALFVLGEIIIFSTGINYLWHYMVRH